MSQAAYSQIKERIMTGGVQPGQELRERDLAGELGMSRTPVREALGRLESEGLVVRGPQSSLAVAQPTLADVFDLLDLRELVEGLAARRAAERASRYEAEGLLASARELDTEQAAPSKELRFHTTLVSLARQPYLTRTFESQSVVQYTLILALAIDPSEDNRELQHPHEAIAQAILERNPDAAEESARAHVREARESLAQHVMGNLDRREELLRELPALSLGPREAEPSLPVA